MIDDYLNTFDGIFFNVEKYEPVKLAIDQVGAVLSSIITRYGEIENEISCGTSRQDDFIDTVICLFVRKIMEQLDAINVLYSVGSFSKTISLQRQIFQVICTSPRPTRILSISASTTVSLSSMSILSQSFIYPLIVPMFRLPYISADI